MELYQILQTHLYVQGKYYLTKTGAGHSLYLPGGSRPQYGRHIYVRPSQGLNPRPPHQTAEALTHELWRQLLIES